MLVLTRKRFEQIQIGDDIRIKVIKTGRGAVKIGIEAPEHVRVMRAELCDKPVSPPRVEAAEFSETDCKLSGYASSDQFPHAV